MKAKLSRVALVVAVWGALVGACDKKKSGSSTTWDPIGHSPLVDRNRAAAAKLKAPAILAQVPADTPYVFALLEPIPQAYWSRVCDEVCPQLEKLFANGATMSGQRIGDRVIRAIAGEVAGKLSKDGLASLGLRIDQHMVIYGLGTLPVLRVDLGDPAAFKATIARVEKNSGFKLPERTLSLPGASPFYYWSGNGRAVAIGVVGKEVVATFGRIGAVEAELPVLFGNQKLPGPTMADGAALKKIAAEYGFAGYGVGYVDFHKLIEALYPTPMPVAAAPGQPAPAAPNADCRGVLDYGAAVVSRVVFGYEEISTKRAWATAVVETDAKTAAALKAAQLSVPGVSARMPKGAMLMLGGAVDRGKLTPLYHRAKAWALAASKACGDGALADLQNGFGNLGMAGGFDFSDVRGVMLGLLSVDVSGGMPQGAEGYAIVGVKDASAFLQSLGVLLGSAAGKVSADGKFHTVDLGPISSFIKSPLKIAGKDGAVVVAAGDKGRATAEDATRGPAAPSPFLVLAYDIGKLQGMIASVVPAQGGDMDAMDQAYTKLLGPFIVSVGPHPHGLGITMQLDIR